MISLGLYQGDGVEQTLRKEYFAGVRDVMLVPVKASLEQTLAGLGEAPKAPPPVVEKPKAAPKPAPKPARGPLPIVPIGYELPMFDGTAPRGVIRAAHHSVGPAAFVRVQATVPQPSKAAIVESLRQATAPTPAGRNDVRLEDGYNALKTYLMLKEQKRMEGPHLSDQIPKYWRPWLAANRGKASAEDLNRMAERVVAFYVSQIEQPDLPLIENRADLIGQSREMLRGAFRRLSATERVYNELKARANTQFAPMTVGRMLDNRDLDVVAGSLALPGVFTREAWDKYLRGAFAEASKGEVKGDDWVLASSSLDNLAKDGDVERNRLALETLYRTEFVNEWKKFLQGIAVHDFGSVQNASQALGKLSNPQTSALKTIIARAAFETSWDNPSQLSKSLETAKHSVLERTEKLVLGGAQAVPVSAQAQQYGELGGRFAVLATVSANGEGGRAPLAGYLDMLTKLKGKLSVIAANEEPGAPARQLMAATLAGTGSEFAEALNYVDSVLLANASEESKEIIRPLLVRPLIQAYATLIPPVEQDLNRAWQNEVLGYWRPLSSKYPFAESANEASLTDIAKFLKPGEGVLSRFIDKNLNGLVSKRGDQLVARTWSNLGVGFNPAFLGGVARLTSVGNSLLQEGESAKFELQPLPTPGLSETLIEVDGQELRYRNGPQPWTSFSWPNGANAQNAKQGARIQVVSFAGAPTSVANFSGRLGFMRLLTQAKVSDHGNQTAKLEWTFRPAGAKTDAEGETVRFNFRLVSGANPLSLAGLRRLGLPDKIAN